MDSHLSEEQFAEWLLGSDKPGVRRHLKSCSQCSAQAEALCSRISQLRQSAHAEAERDEMFWTRQRLLVRERLPRDRPVPFLRGVAAAMAAMVLCAVFLLTRSPQPTPSVANDVTDNALLEMVAIDIDRNYPAALEPAEMISLERETTLSLQRDFTLNEKELEQ